MLTEGTKIIFQEAVRAAYRQGVKDILKKLERHFNKVGKKEYDKKIITVSFGTNWLTKHGEELMEKEVNK